MAFLKTATSPHGFIAPQAYHSVDNVGLSKSEIRFQLKISREKGGEPFTRLNFAIPLNLEEEKNVYRRAYDYLKSLPEYEGSIDC